MSSKKKQHEKIVNDLPLQDSKVEIQEEIQTKDEENVKDLEIAELKDKLLRQIADFDNFRKRTLKEKDAAYGNGVCDTVSAILPAIDNLERAYTVSLESDKMITEGISMVLKQFESILDSLGVCEIDAINTTFDHNLHNAIMHVEDEQYDEQQIIEVFQKGYKMDDRVIRHSTVKVAN